jgi:DnaJ-class molecular chaperone
MSDIDPYGTLGVSKDASDAEIKRAWRKLARQYHPDRNPGDSAAEDRFKRIQEAGDLIGTPEARKKYDEESQMRNMFGGAGPGGVRFDFGGGGNPFGGGGMGGIEDMLGAMFGGSGGNPFGGGMPRQAPQQQKAAPKGKDLSIHLDLSIQEALEGGKRTISFTRLVRGHVGNMQKENKKINVNIPEQAKHGQSIRLKGMGHEHPEGGKVGDAHIVIRIDPGENRRWENGSLIQVVAVPYSTLLLGGKVKITTPSGKSGNLTIQPNSRIGDRRRMAKMGFDGGDLDLELALMEVDELSEQQRKLLGSLREQGL